MSKWEYQFQPFIFTNPGPDGAFDPVANENKLNELGADGWEVVHTFSNKFLLRRPVGFG